MRAKPQGAAGSGVRELEAKCTGVRLQKDRPVIKLEGITDRTMADELRGMEIYIREDQLEELPEGQHYVRDIIGYKVIDLATGKEVGVLKDVIQNTAQNVLDIEGSRRQADTRSGSRCFPEKIRRRERSDRGRADPGIY